MRTASRNTSTTALAVIALAVASMLAPSLAHAKRMGGGGRMMAPSRMARPATPPPAPRAPAAAPAPAVTPPAAAAAPARGPGMMGMVGAAAVGGLAGTMAGNAMAGNNKDQTAAKAKEAEAAEKEAADLQQKADAAKAKADAARAAVR